MEKLIITKKNGYVVSSLFDEKELVLVQAEKIEQESILGNIYIGKVKNIVKNITPLSLLNSISNEVKLIQQEQNILSISEFNKIITKHNFPFYLFHQLCATLANLIKKYVHSFKKVILKHY